MIVALAAMPLVLLLRRVKAQSKAADPILE
jgi:hypothetical protein